MRPRRTERSNHVFRLQGGTEDNDLWCQRDVEEGQPVVHSTWELDQEEREAIAAGANVELTVWGGGHPPVAMRPTTQKLGKPTEGESDGQ